MFRGLAAIVMVASLITATAVSIVWVAIADGPDVLESSAQTLGLLAALTAIVAERLAAESQRRRQALAALTDELRKNDAIITDLRVTLGRSARRRVYPRLLTSAVDGVITSGVLAVGGNQELVSTLHQWRNEVVDFNRRLDLTEMLTFLQGTPEVIHGFEKVLNSDNGRLHRIDTRLRDLLDSLTDATVDRSGKVGRPAPARQSRRASDLVDQPVPVIPEPTRPGDDLAGQPHRPLAR